MLPLLAAASPEDRINLYISPNTILLAGVVGIAAVALAPVFLTRRLKHMNIPDTLRVME